MMAVGAFSMHEFFASQQTRSEIARSRHASAGGEAGETGMATTMPLARMPATLLNPCGIGG